MLEFVKFKTLLCHKFHLVNRSQLPFIMSLSSLLVVTSIVFYWHTLKTNVITTIGTHIAIIFFLYVIISWLLMVLKESSLGFHTDVVGQGLRYGVMLFIVSEIMFFFALFWSFFHYSLSPSIEIGCVWPPLGTPMLNPWGLPLTNTILLLSSGVTITLAHHSIKKIHDYVQTVNFWTHLAATIILGLIFLFCQWVEYTYGLRFRWNDNVYGSIFFVATGFHGFHVLLGTFGLFFCWIRSLLTSNVQIFNIIITKLMFKCSLPLTKQIEIQNLLALKVAPYNFSHQAHIGFEAALWYWHFVDVVWIFLFCTVYWWGSPITINNH